MKTRLLSQSEPVGKGQRAEGKQQMFPWPQGAEWPDKVRLKLINMRWNSIKNVAAGMQLALIECHQCNL